MLPPKGFDNIVYKIQNWMHYDQNQSNVALHLWLYNLATFIEPGMDFYFAIINA